MNDLRINKTHLIFSFLLLTSALFSQQVVINEIMNAPSGGEPEWIEILNFSSEPINLKNWKISNRLITTKYTITTEDYILQPDSYAVITRSDTIYYFHSLIPSKVFIVPQIPSARFRNDSDAVVLFDSSNTVIDSVYYKSDWVRVGYSIERIYPNRNSNLKSTWGISKDSERSTPGRKNSIMAKAIDLMVKDIAISPEQIFQGQNFNVKSTIYNIGIFPVGEFSASFFIDLNGDSIFQSDEKFFEEAFSQFLNSGDSINFEFTLQGLPSGTYISFLKVSTQGDEDETNNTVKKQIKILQPPLSFNSIVINEIMYAPKSPEPEWIELFNRTNESVDLLNWKIGDSQTLKSISSTFKISPGDYVILTSKDTIFSVYPWLNRSKVLLISLPILNNDEDAVRIYDQYNNLIDSVYYTSAMGGGNGFSLERISPDLPSNSPQNWGTSRSPFKATPLSKNSLTQKDKDLTITGTISPDKILKSQQAEIQLIIKNIGKISLANFKTKVFFDTNNDSIPQVDELIVERVIPNVLSPYDSTLVSFSFVPTELKTYKFIALVFHPEDEDSLNDKFYFQINVSTAEGSVLINEIMFAPSGDEPEWVEIFNASQDTINLKNWSISDATKKVNITKNDFLLYPNEFLILTADSSILNFYNIGSKLISLQLPTLNNTDDAVAIYDKTGSKIDSVYYRGSWGKTGYSIERIDLEESSNDSTNWAIPPDSIKATPGRENFTKRKNFDIAVKSVQTPPSVDTGAEFYASVVVQNVGINRLNEFTINVFNDINRDSIGSEAELILSKSFTITLNKKDSAVINLKLQNLEPGENFLLFAIQTAQDENPKNNSFSRKINVGFAQNSIVINEIMFDPLPGYSEYIELYNRSNRSVNLKLWKFNDMRNQGGKANFITLLNSDFELSPGEYLLIAPDSTILNYFTKDDSLDFKLIILNKGLSLNNDFDDVVITDLTGKIIDSVRYSSTWHSPILFDKKGRSLEKVNPDLPSAERSSWTSSSSIKGGTPGHKNTAFVEIGGKPSTGKVTITPNPFSPDGDGFEDVCIISYTLPFNSALISVKIFDSYGRLVKTLATSQYSSREGNLIWDGSNDGGKILRIGIYIILFEARSESGEKFTQKLTVVLAKKL
jgi:hypothetical protein